MRYENKALGASFELPDDVSQLQFETWERRMGEALGNMTGLAPAATSRAAVEAAYEAGFVTSGERTPQAASDVQGWSARVIWWMSDEISKYIKYIKTIPPPNS